jgi:DNA-binding beta-propeller fold protein YncE
MSATQNGWRMQAGLALFALMIVSPVAAHDVETRVAALAPVSGGQLALLDASSGLYLVDPKIHTLRRLPSIFSPYTAVDLETSAQGDQIFVTMILQGKSSRARLARYDLAGNLTGEWLSTGGAAAWTGAAITADGRAAYVANTGRPEIYRLDLTRSRSAPSHVASMRGSNGLGAVVLDARRQRLLVADSFQGLLFEVKLDGSGSSILLRDLEEPSAMALDPAADRLFIAEASEGQVLVVNLGEAKARARTFARIDALDEFHALTLGRDGTFWIADFRTSTLYHLAHSGATIESFRPKLVAAPARR